MAQLDAVVCMLGMPESNGWAMLPYFLIINSIGRGSSNNWNSAKLSISFEGTTALRLQGEENAS
jgi:hypothetical protein